MSSCSKEMPSVKKRIQQHDMTTKKSSYPEAIRGCKHRPLNLMNIILLTLPFPSGKFT